MKASGPSVDNPASALKVMVPTITSRKSPLVFTIPFPTEVEPENWIDVVARNRYNFPGFNAVWEEKGMGSTQFREAVNTRYSLFVESGAEKNFNVAYCGV